MHEHHVTPRYRDPNSTLTVVVTVTQHAMFHYCNWQLWGDRRDWIAWKNLTGQIGKEETQRELSSLGGRNNTGKPKSKEHREKIALSVSEVHKTTDTRKRISSAMKGNSNSQSQKSPEARKRHSEIMKAVWARRKSGT